MFTGIIEEVGWVKSIQPGRLVISADKVLEGVELGDSIALNGACLTVVSISGNSFSIDVMSETMRLTNLGRLSPGAPLNLERALPLGGRLGGHLVQGHVDATGRVISLLPEETALIAAFAAPPEVMRYIVPRGFIAVDGVSLTVIDCDTTSFKVSLVAYTQQHTTLGSRKPGDLVNLEVDIIAKYIERLTERGGSDITPDFLAEHGFLI